MERPDGPARPGSTRSGTLFLLVLLGISLSINVVLGWRVRSFKDALHQDQNPVGSPRLEEGAFVSPLTAQRRDGTQHPILFTDTDKLTVLYVFSHTCVWCARNVDSVRSLANATVSTHRFVGLSIRDINNVEMEDEEQKLGFPVFRGLSRDTLSALGLGSTPQTIVVSPRSTVVKNWVGFYGGPLHKEIEAYFGVSLVGTSKTEQSDDAADSPQSCTRCVLEGLFYSRGAVVYVGDRKLRCSADGQWAEDR